MLRSGNRGKIDLLAMPKDPRLASFAFAIEVKARERIMQKGLAAWIKQASDYVGAVPDDGLPIPQSAFLWTLGMEEPAGEDILRLRAMLDVAHQFRVGAVRARLRGGFSFHMGPDEMFRSTGWGPSSLRGDPWPGRALERLTSRRTSAGGRRRAGE